MKTVLTTCNWGLGEMVARKRITLFICAMVLSTFTFAQTNSNSTTASNPGSDTTEKKDPPPVFILSSPKSPMQDQMRDGLDKLRKKDVDGAILVFSRVLEKYPDNATAHYQRGKAFAMKGLTEQALEDLTKAAELEPKNKDAHLLKGKVLLQLRRMAECIESFQNSLDITPQSAVYILRANCLMSAQKPIEAMEDYARAIDMSEHLPEAFYSRGTANYNLGDYNDAIADFSSVIELSPDNAKGYFKRGMSTLAKLDLTHTRITISEGDKLHIAACEDFEKATELGHPMGAQFVKNYCTDHALQATDSLSVPE